MMSFLLGKLIVLRFLFSRPTRPLSKNVEDTWIEGFLIRFKIAFFENNRL